MLKALYRRIIPAKTAIRVDDRRRFIKMYFRSRERFRTEWAGRQCKTSYGIEHPDKTFFVIRRHAYDEGLFSMLNYVMAGLHRAEVFNYVPVVDLKNCYSAILQSEETKGKENAWEYFFKQPAGYSVEDIECSRHIVLSDMNSLGEIPDYYYGIEGMNLELWSKLYRKYIRYSDYVTEKLEVVEKETPFQNKRVLGITIRRGIEWGYSVGAENYMTYPMQLDFAGYIDLIKQKMQEWDCDHVFVSIDDKEGAEILREEFGDRLLIMDRARRVYFKGGKPMDSEEKNRTEDAKYEGMSQKDKIERETLYLIETILLSRCNCLIATKTSANVAALMMNGGNYEHIYEI